LGEKILDEHVTLYTDPFHPDAPAAPWTGDGQARKKMDLIKNGVVANLFYDRYWAQQKNVAPVPFPGNCIMEGGTASQEDLIKDTKKGILVTRFWYIRAVDPQTQLYTGLTRDATFFIENGKIKHPIKNFRFNESPVIMLNNVETLGKQTRVDVQGGGGGNGGVSFMLPVMRIRDFTFTSLSDAV
jgi:predicted Zn-dependent protease